MPTLLDGTSKCDIGYDNAREALAAAANFGPAPCKMVGVNLFEFLQMCPAAVFF